MKRPDSKTQAIRILLAQAHRPLHIDELQPRLERKLKQIISKPKLYTLLSLMINARELDTVGRADNRFYWFR